MQMGREGGRGGGEGRGRRRHNLKRTFYFTNVLTLPPSLPPSLPPQANYKIWPLANLINFSVVPLKFRVLFANVISVFWNMYLSAASNR